MLGFTLTRTIGAAAALCLVLSLTTPSWASGYYAVGWYPIGYDQSNFDSNTDYCDPVARPHQQAPPSYVLFGSCTFWAGVGDQSLGYVNQGYNHTITVSGSSGYVSATGLTVTRAFSTVVNRNIAPSSNSQRYLGAVWNSPNACNNRSQFRLVYNSVANYSTGAVIAC